MALHGSPAGQAAAILGNPRDSIIKTRRTSVTAGAGDKVRSPVILQINQNRMRTYIAFQVPLATRGGASRRVAPSTSRSGSIEPLRAIGHLHHC